MNISATLKDSQNIHYTAENVRFFYLLLGKAAPAINSTLTAIIEHHVDDSLISLTLDIEPNLNPPLSQRTDMAPSKLPAVG